MSVNNLLSRLDRVKRTGQGRWMACCPVSAHSDKHRSLSVRELDDGVILLHCFSGCTVHEVVGAVGLRIDDLFPPRDIEHGRPERRPFPAADILRAISFETTLVLIAAADLLAGNPFNETDRARLALAAGRIRAALDAGGLS